MPEIRTISAQQFVQLAIERGRRLELNVMMVDARCDYCHGSGQIKDFERDLVRHCTRCAGQGSQKMAFPIFGTQYGA